MNWTKPLHVCLISLLLDVLANGLAQKHGGAKNRLAAAAIGQEGTNFKLAESAEKDAPLKLSAERRTAALTRPATSQAGNSTFPQNDGD